MELVVGVAIVGGFLVAFFTLFLSRIPSTAQIASDPQKLAETETVPAVDLGNGLFFLDVGDGPSWIASLKRFINEHPTLRITAIAPATEGKLGAYSRLIVTEHRHTCPCHVDD